MLNPELRITNPRSHALAMKAALRSRYGSPDVLRVETCPRPSLQDHEVMIRVHATTVNRTDCGVLSGSPLIFRLFTGFPRPRFATPGTDFAGVIEAVGAEVQRFQVGDRVWGFDDNSLPTQAEYFTLAADRPIMPIPEGVSFAEAAASAEGLHYAYNFLRSVPVEAGQAVMVNGATGAIGAAVVPLLKAKGCRVVATCRGEHLDLVKALGADRVIDYLQTDFTQDEETYHYVFDAVGKSTFGACKRLLHPGGAYLSSELGPKAQNLWLALITPLLGGKKVVFPVPTNVERSLRFVQPMLASGQFRPLIDRHYPLEDIAAAYEYVASGQKVGNVILEVTP